MYLFFKFWISCLVVARQKVQNRIGVHCLKKILQKNLASWVQAMVLSSITIYFFFEALHSKEWSRNNFEVSSLEIWLHKKMHYVKWEKELDFSKLIFQKSSTDQQGVRFIEVCTPFENAQRWMGKNIFPFLLLNDDNMIGEH